MGLGQLESETGKLGVSEPDESLYRAVKSIFRRGSAGTTEAAFLETVRKIIFESLKEGSPQLGRVADALGFGPRTLERRLSRAGFNFTKLVDDTRQRLAIELLTDPRNKLTDIALRLGYSEVSAFNRAFKRWTNSTPLNFRRVNLPSARSHSR